MGADAQGRRKDPYRKFQYRVYTLPHGGLPNPIPKGSNVHFSEVSGLRGETEVVEYKEGNEALTRKLPGKTSYGGITLARGIDSGGHLAKWRKAIVEDGGNPNASLRAILVIEVKDRIGKNIVKTYRALACWPSSYEVEDLAGGSSDVLVERIEFAVEKILQDDQGAL